MIFIFDLINLAAVEKTKLKSIIELQYSERNKKIKLKKNLFYFFIQFSKNWVGRVGKMKNKKKLWPNEIIFQSDKIYPCTTHTFILTLNHLQSSHGLK